MPTLLKSLFKESQHTFFIHACGRQKANLNRIVSYGVDGLRHCLNGAVHFGLATDLIVLFAVAALLLALSSYLFSRIEV